jgi:hypothetical protein
MLASPAMRRRLRAATLLAATFVPALPTTPAGATSDEGYRGVEVRDNVFAQRIVRVAVGATWVRLVAGGLTIYVVLTALAIGLGS